MNVHLASPTRGSRALSRCAKSAAVRASAFSAALRASAYIAPLLASAGIAASLWSAAPVWPSDQSSTSWPDGIAANEPVTFSVTGDVPYGSSEVTLFQQQIDEHDVYSPSEFIVHLGDIKSGGESCTEGHYTTMANILKSSVVPAYIVPGDNETIDCSNPSQGWQYWVQHLLGIESNWICSPATTRQSGRQENFVFVHKGILFVGIHLVGGTNDSAIMQDDADWVSQKLQQQNSQVRGAVIFAQAGPGGNLGAFFDPFETAAQDFGKPILFIHGDGHTWRLDNPFAAANVTRVQVTQGGLELPVQVTATLSTTNMFQFVRDPWDSNSQPVTRLPCGGSSPTLAVSDVGIDEGNAGTVSAVFTVTLSNPTGQSVSVQYATANGTAQAGQDYTAKSGTISFSGSTTTRTISVAVLGDIADEPDETFFVDLSNASGATVTDSRGQGTIRDDDSPGTPSTIAFDPVADAYVQSSSPTKNSGSSTELRVKTDSSIYRAYLKFALTGVGDFNAAKLRLYVTDGTPIAGTMHAVSNTYAGSATAWTEGGINWSNAPPITSPALASLGSVSAGTWVEFDVTAGIGGDGTFSFALQSTSSNSGRYGSKENSNKPQLVLYLPGVPGPGNTPPVAADDSRAVAEDGALSVAAPGVLGNDTDDDGDALTAVVTSSTAHGTLSLQENGSFSYTPQPNFNGTDGFTYRASDGRGGSDTAGVAITVTPVDDAPSAVAESYAVQAGITLSVPAPGVLGNDSDADGNALTAALVRNVVQGALVLQSAGSFTYTPNAGASGTDSFTYRASDGSLQSAETTVTLNIGGAPGSGNVTFVDMQTGGSTATAGVSTSNPMGGASGDLFLAAIATKPSRTVNGLSGLGLAWSRVRAQCGGRAQTGMEIWMARGTPSTGTVSATLASSVENAVIAVARYAGADPTMPLGNVVSGNTNGVSGSCTNGIDNPSYSLGLATQVGATVFGGVALRARIHTPGSGWTERTEIHQGSGGGVAGLAVADQGATSTSLVFAGAFESTVDWAAIAVEIRPSGAVAKAGSDTEAADAWANVQLERVFPNPMTHFASFAYELPGRAAVEVTIYNARGQRVSVLARDVQPAGRHLLRWDTTDAGGARVPAGVYFLRATLGTRTVKQKLVVQR